MTHGIGITHFDDGIVSSVCDGSRPLTTEEREFLVADTPRFEECDVTSEHLATLSDPDLMRHAYGCWAEYASGQI